MKPYLMLMVGALVVVGCATLDNRREIAGPYDEAAVGEELVRVALNRATQEEKRVLAVFGANWCSDCRALDALFKSDPAIAAQLRESYLLVKLDVGRNEIPRKNSALIERFGAAIETGIPVLVVVDAQGTPLNDTRKERLADSAHGEPAAVLAFLRQWSK